MAQPTIEGKLGFFFNDKGDGTKWMHNGADWIPYELMNTGVLSLPGAEIAEILTDKTLVTREYVHAKFAQISTGFDPSASYTITGDWVFTQKLLLSTGLVSDEYIESKHSYITGSNTDIPGMFIRAIGATDTSVGIYSLPDTERALRLKGFGGIILDNITAYDSSINNSIIDASGDNTLITKGYLNKHTGGELITFAQLVAKAAAGNVEVWDRYIITDQSNLKLEIKHKTSDDAVWYETINSEGSVTVKRVE